jgi:hypothetical protein
MGSARHEKEHPEGHINSAGCGKLSGFSPEREATRGKLELQIHSN